MTEGKSLQEWFEERLPMLVRKADFHLRPIRGEAHDEAVAETLALAWSRFVRLEERGKPLDDLVGPVIHYSARQVLNGRRLAGQERARDVNTRRTQNMMHFIVEPLDDSALAAVPDNRATPADQAAFRTDFKDWRSRFCKRDQDLMDELGKGFTTSEAAERYKISPARISQLREKFRLSWEESQAR